MKKLKLFILKLLTKLNILKKHSKFNDVPVYLIWYKIIADENINRDTLSCNLANSNIIGFFKANNLEIKYYQIININSEYFVMFSNEEAINKKLYCMFLLTMNEIKDKNYKGAYNRYFYKQEIINKQTIIFYKFKNDIK